MNEFRYPSYSGCSWVIGIWTFGEKLDFEMLNCSPGITYESQGILQGEAKIGLQW